jgi:hypothetical protein
VAGASCPSPLPGRLAPVEIRSAPHHYPRTDLTSPDTSMHASHEPEPIPRLNPPPEGQTLRGWCLYQDDRWDGPVPQEYDDQGCGKSLVTNAPSSDSGTKPIAPLRASMRDAMKFPALATIRLPFTEPPETRPRSTTPLPQSLTVISEYSREGSGVMISPVREHLPQLHQGPCFAHENILPAMSSRVVRKCSAKSPRMAESVPTRSGLCRGMVT